MRPQPSFDELVELAVGRGLAFLGHRGRTIHETRNRLIQRGFSSEVSDAAVMRLREMGYLDDEQFCISFVDDRRRLDAWGDDRIRRRLRDLGAPPAEVEAALSGDEESGELQRAIDLLERRLSEPVEGVAAHRRAMGILVRRGYSSETAADAIRAHARGDG